jgi:hypothetical protein
MRTKCFAVFNFRWKRSSPKIFNDENFPIYGIHLASSTQTLISDRSNVNVASLCVRTLLIITIICTTTLQKFIQEAGKKHHSIAM